MIKRKEEVKTIYKDIMLVYKGGYKSIYRECTNWHFDDNKLIFDFQRYDMTLKMYFNETIEVDIDDLDKLIID